MDWSTVIVFQIQIQQYIDCLKTQEVFPQIMLFKGFWYIKDMHYEWQLKNMIEMHISINPDTTCLD